MVVFESVRPSSQTDRHTGSLSLSQLHSPAVSQTDTQCQAGSQTDSPAVSQSDRQSLSVRQAGGQSDIQMCTVTQLQSV